MATPLMPDSRSKLGSSVTCTVSINNRSVCVHDSVWKRCKVSLERGIFDSWCECWTLGEQEGYTVPDFFRQIETAWRKLNNITTPRNPDEGKWE